jgi:hypothetical protein
MTRNRNAAKTPKQIHPPLADLARFSAAELDALIASCQQDMPEIMQPAPHAVPAPHTPATPAPALKKKQCSVKCSSAFKRERGEVV